MFRQGGGRLEHASSTLLTANPQKTGTPEGYERWLGFVSHEYFHAFNVKRLRPRELERSRSKVARAMMSP